MFNLFIVWKDDLKKADKTSNLQYIINSSFKEFILYQIIITLRLITNMCLNRNILSSHQTIQLRSCKRTWDASKISTNSIKKRVYVVFRKTVSPSFRALVWNDMKRWEPTKHGIKFPRLLRVRKSVLRDPKRGSSLLFVCPRQGWERGALR